MSNITNYLYKALENEKHSLPHSLFSFVPCFLHDRAHFSQSQ